MIWRSQAGQDEWVATITGFVPGFFVDVGAHDGLVHSNTYALETQLGWNGICVEPEMTAFQQLEGHRRAECVNVAVSSTTGSEYFDGVRIVSWGGITVTTATLSDVLMMNAAPPKIDYLSIDVEGHEMHVLAGMDFERWHVNLMTIEHNEYLEGPERKLAIRSYLKERGFVVAIPDVVAPGYGVYEDWFRNVEFRAS